MAWSILPWPLSWISLWWQGTWDSDKHPNQVIVLPKAMNPPTHGGKRITRRIRHKRKYYIIH
jgi:hypothetical protein